MERIILETLFGTDSDEHIEYLCIAKKEGHYNIWYFSEINGEVHCLACAKRDSDLTKDGLEISKKNKSMLILSLFQILKSLQN